MSSSPPLSFPDAPMAASMPALTRRVVGRSFLWRMLETGGNEALSFFFFLFVARLLVPQDFGIVAPASAVIALMNVLLNSGLSDALVKDSALSERRLRVAMSYSAVAGLVLCLLAAALAWPLARWLERPDFAPVLLALAPTLLLQGLTSPLQAMLRKRLDFRAVALRTLGAALFGGAVALLLARSGAGHWALVAQQWCISALGLAILLVISPVRPGFVAFARAELEPLLRMAWPIAFGQFVYNAGRRLEPLALGVFLLNHELGLYFLAMRLVYSVQMVTQNVAVEISLPLLSRLGSDAARQGRALSGLLRATLLVATVVFGLLAILAPWVIPRVFGAQWREATQVFVILASFAGVASVPAMVGQALISAGRTATFTRLVTLSSLAQLAAVFVAARWGLAPAAMASGAMQVIAMLAALFLLRRHVAFLPAGSLLSVAVLLLLNVVLIVRMAVGMGTAGTSIEHAALEALALCVLALVLGLIAFRDEITRLRRPS